MPKVIRGTRDAQGNVILRGEPGGSRRIRCLKCNGMATAASRPDGTQVLRCNICGAEYQSKPMK